MCQRNLITASSFGVTLLNQVDLDIIQKCKRNSELSEKQYICN